MNERNLSSRLFQFAVDVIKATRGLPQTPEYKITTYQLLKAATSSGANYEESQGAVSKADFSNKVGISLKEMREANYWIRLIGATQEDQTTWTPLEKESEELKKILGSIYSKTSKSR